VGSRIIAKTGLKGFVGYIKSYYEIRLSRKLAKYANNSGDTVIQLTLIVGLVAVILIVVGVYAMPGVKPAKIITCVLILALLIEGGLILWIYKAANRLPPGAQLIDQDQISDKE
jgi:hypothetical protein